MKNGLINLRYVGIVLLIGMAPTVASAYIDPGNGAYMVQVLFTLVGAAIFYLRHPIATFRALMRWVFNRRKKEEFSSSGAQTSALPLSAGGALKTPGDEAISAPDAQ
jgi:hypothetical protein